MGGDNLTFTCDFASFGGVFWCGLRVGSLGKRLLVGYLMKHYSRTIIERK